MFVSWHFYIYFLVPKSILDFARLSNYLVILKFKKPYCAVNI